MIKLWHCKGSRSLRPLWALEEMGLEYELVSMKFPPRVFHKEYKAINPLGTVPFMADGDTRMSESTAICHYLVEKYQRYEFGLPPDDPQYGAYLNWLYMSDATLTFPQTLVMRYGQFEPEERRLPQAVEDYSQWYLARLRTLDEHIRSRQYLCGNRFTIADIAVGYALYLGEIMTDQARHYQPQTRDYLARLKERAAFKRAMEK